MENFTNRKTVYFKELQTDGRYSEELLKNLKSGNYKFLNLVEFIKLRTQPEFMEPIFYAVRNENNTYAIYTFLGKNIQEGIAKNNIPLAIEIIKEDPKLIIDTPLGDSEEVILNAVTERPEVITCMSYGLRKNINFISKLCDIQNDEVRAYAGKVATIPQAIIENPSLTNNIDFMKGAIINNPEEAFKYANETIKDNYEIIKEASRENKEVIDYVSEHTDEFGEEAIKGAKESLAEHIMDNIDSKFEEERKKIQVERNKDKSQDEQRLERTENSVKRIKSKFEEMIAYAYSEELNPEEQIKAHEKIIKRAGSILNIVKGMPEDTRELLEQYKTMSAAELVKINERNEKVQDNNMELKDIEEISEKAELSGIQYETTFTTREIIIDRENKTKEDDELGEK